MTGPMQPDKLNLNSHAIADDKRAELVRGNPHRGRQARFRTP